MIFIDFTKKQIFCFITDSNFFPDDFEYQRNFMRRTVSKCIITIVCSKSEFFASSTYTLRLTSLSLTRIINKLHTADGRNLGSINTGHSNNTFVYRRSKNFYIHASNVFYVSFRISILMIGVCS